MVFCLVYFTAKANEAGIVGGVKLMDLALGDGMPGMCQLSSTKLAATGGK